MTIKDAQAIYREAWTQYRMSTDRDVQKAMKVTMDHVQPHCTSTGAPGDEWYEFIETLPGYKEHWGRLRDRCNEMALEKYGASVFLKPS